MGGVKHLSELQIASLEYLKCEKEYVIVNYFAVKSVKEMSRNSGDKMMIVNSNGTPIEFEQESTMFRSIDDSMKKDMYFEVYAPLEYTSRLDRNKKLERLKEQVLKILKEMVVNDES